MKQIQFEITTNPLEADLKTIDTGIAHYNQSRIGKQKYVPIGCFARIDHQVIGGISGNLFWNYLYIDIMWIHENYRKQGIGSKLIEKIERLSIKNEIYRSHLCTASFQAVEFYEKCGYTIFGKLEDMPEGETEFYLYKRLRPL